jgi:hypothetical protein
MKVMDLHALRQVGRIALVFSVLFAATMAMAQGIPFPGIKPPAAGSGCTYCPPGSTKLAYDNFPGSSPRANWTANGSTWTITSNSLFASAVSNSQYGIIYYNAVSPNGNQYASVTVPNWTRSGNVRVGVGIDFNTINLSGYYLYCDTYSGTTCTLLILVKSANFATTGATEIQAFSGVNVTAGETLTLARVNGTTLRAYSNGSAFSPDVTDSTYTSGVGFTAAWVVEVAGEGRSYFETGNMP